MVWLILSVHAHERIALGRFRLPLLVIENLARDFLECILAVHLSLGLTHPLLLVKLGQKFLRLDVRDFTLCHGGFNLVDALLVFLTHL